MPKSNPRTEQKKTARILKLIRLLSNSDSRPTIPELADSFGVDARTLRRDLNTLSDAGFVLREEGEKEGRRRVLRLGNDAPLSSPLGFTSDELASLYLTREIYSVLKGTHFEKAAESALGKIEASFNPETAERLKNAVRVKTGPLRSYAGHGDTIKLLTGCILERRALRLAYDSRSSGRYDRFIVHPYTLIFHNNALYLFAYSEKHRETRNFAVERIGFPEKLAQSFQMPENTDKLLNLDSHFGIYAGDVTEVRIKVAAAHRKRMKDKIIHASQTFSFSRDGSMVIALRAAGKEDLFRWLLSQVDAVRLLEPEAWVREFKGMLDKMMRTYQ